MKNKAILFLFFMCFLPGVIFADVSVLTATPFGFTDGSDSSDVITVVFNQPMVALESLPSGDGNGPLVIEPAVPGKFRWSGTNTLLFKPNKRLKAASSYQVIVSAGLKSEVSGEELKQDYKWGFETVRPMLLSSKPSNGSGWNILKTKIFLYFNLHMDVERVKGAFKLYEKDNFGRRSETGIEVSQPKQEDYDKVKNSFGYYIRQADITKTLIITPSGQLKRDTNYEFVVPKGLTAKGGGLGTTGESVIEFTTYKKFTFIEDQRQDGYDPKSGIQLNFSNPVKYKTLLENIGITPEVKISDYYYQNNNYSYGDNYGNCPVAFECELKPETTYRVKVRKGMTDIFGQTLEAPVDWSFTTSAYEPYMSMPDGVGVIESYVENPSHPLSVINIDKVDLTIRKLGIEDIIPYLTNNKSGGKRTVDRVWKLDTKRNEGKILPIELKPGLKGKKNGILYVQVKTDQDLGEYEKKKYVLLQVTALGITAKFSPDNNLIYVSFLKDASPAGGCEVQLRNTGNKVLWTGFTDKDGFVLAPGWEELKIIPADKYEKPVIWVMAKKDGDVAFISSNTGTGIEPYNFNIDLEYYPEAPSYGGHIFTERGIYRPGEKVYIKGIIREKRKGTWVMPRKKVFDLVIKNSRGAEICNKPVTLSNDFGSFNFKIELPKDSVTGFYSVDLSEKGMKKSKKPASGEDEEYTDTSDRAVRFNSSFRVEEYKPANFEVLTKLDADEYIAGDRVKASLKGWYLFGAPMSKSEAEYTARLDKSYFEPAGYPGYVFTRSYWYDESYYTAGSRVLVSETSALDSSGNKTFDFKVNQDDGPGTYQLMVEGNVTSPDRQRISGRKSAVVHGAQFYIGMKPGSTFIEKDKEFSVDLIAVNPAGALAENKQVECRLIRREWNSVREAIDGRLQWKTEKKDTPIAKFSFTSALEPYTWKFLPDKAGLYLLVAKSEDKRGNKVLTTIDFYVTGQDYCAWERTDDDRIDLVCDKVKYKPGETALIMVKSPYENAKAVVTFEREGIMKQWTTQLKGSADTISVPIDQSMLPNVYVCVMLYQGRLEQKAGANDKDDVGKPSFKVGYTNLPVDPGGKSLKVAVSTDKTDYKPGQTAVIKLKVTDELDKGVQAEVAVAVVDYGILSLINYTTPNSFAYFYGPRGLAVDTSETRLNIIGQRSFGEKGKNRGGGGGMSTAGIDLRSDFVPTAYYNPSVVTKPNGTLELSFKLPESLTSFKVMATAHTKSSMFGGGDSRLSVSKPIMLKPSMPRFAVLGDKFSGGVLCYNNTPKDMTVTVKASAKNMKLDGVSTRVVVVEKNSAKEVRFDFYADTSAKAEFEFYAKMGGESDGFKWSLPVKVPRPSEAVAVYSSTLETAKETIKVPSGIYDSGSRIDISVSSSAMIGLKGGLEYLFDYPYGCLEQRTSKILPQVFSPELFETFNLAQVKSGTAGTNIAWYLNALKKFQHPSGGFMFWEGGGYPSPYLTAYVMWCAGEAKAKGYKADELIMSRAIEYMKSYLREEDSPGWEWPYSAAEKLSTKAFIAYVLSMHKSADQGYINKLYSQLNQMPLTGKAFLLKAIAREKMDRTMIVAVVNALSNQLKMSPTQAHFELSDAENMAWIWDSNVRVTAMILQAILEVEGSYPSAEKITRWLADERKSGSWRTTQENIYVFYALNEYVKHYEKSKPDFAASVKLDNKSVLDEIFKGRQLVSKNRSIGVEKLRRDEALPVEIRKKGDGRLYYELRMVYAPVGQLAERSEGITVEKTIESFKDKSAADSKFKLGEKYIVKLRVNTDQERRFVVVDDPIPAGFEIVNLAFDTESSQEGEKFDKDSDESGASRWWGSFDRSENYDDRVLVFADYLERGEHVFTYLVQATTPGTYLMPAAKAEEMYSPEIFGRTAQKYITVK